MKEMCTSDQSESVHGISCLSVFLNSTWVAGEHFAASHCVAVAARLSSAANAVQCDPVAED